MKHCFTFITLLFCITSAVRAQNASALIGRYLLDHQSELQLSDAAVRSDWHISDQHQSANDPVLHVYVQQTLHGINLYNAISAVAIQNGAVRFFNSGFVPSSRMVANALPGAAAINAQQALQLAAAQKGIDLGELTALESASAMQIPLIFRSSNPKIGKIRVWPVYFKVAGSMRLAWNVELPNAQDWWSIRVDAIDGSILDVGNYTVYCNFSATPDADTKPENFTPSYNVAAENVATAAYQVIPFPGESPNHASWTVLQDPSDVKASPFTWLDTDGQTGVEYSITRGNNVYAYEDANADNAPGYSPDAGPSLQFVFPFNSGISPTANRDPAITNLFYVNNFMHDMTYHYGFDEEAGNFQELNYSGLGLGSDYVTAEALDGSGTSNANFSTPPDGNNGRMQMYVFTAFNPNGQDKDSGLDNGIIAHEYGHGISNRLTGGASNTSCLFNQEQMGEGWSDYYALITTIDHGDNRNTKRPLGTYALGQAIDGPGIRNKLYSTDMAVNSYTYGDLKFTGGETHNIGEIWTVMLWDLTWDLIDTLGYDPDIMYGKGGNNVALRLVTEAMKLQICSPGFVDGRDAILQADQLYFNGAYQCMIWKAFARRGLGFSADQGSSDNYNDGTEAFDIPPYCLIAVNAPIAHFSADRTQTCLQSASVQFNDQTENIAQYWFWDFGDGSTSTKANPIHSFPAEGKYTIKLIVTNNIGSDTLIRDNYITISELPAPSTKDTTVCAGQSAQLNAVVNDPNNIPQWLDANGNLLATGANFITPNLTQPTSYLVRETSSLPVKKVGPTALGAGGFHNSTTIGKIYFTAYRGFTIRSVLVRAQGAGNRTVQLFDESDNVIQTYTIYMLSGQKRVDLNIAIPGPGKYALGAGPNTKLFRSSDNISYPYTLSNVVQITGAGQGLGNFYFYFYDWEIQETACISASAPVNVFVTPGPLADFSIATNSTQATFTDLSSGNPTSWLWSFGDGATSTEANPLHTYASMGVFPVSLTVSDGNCSNTYEKTLDFTSSTQSLPASVLSIQLAPNPATDQVDLRLSGSYQGAFSVILLSSDGRMLRNLAMDTQQGPVFPINLEGFASGMYFVKIETTRGVVIRKLVLR